METPRIRIMLVDDHQIIRDSWKALLENNPLLEVVETSALTESVIQTARKARPDIILLDIHLPPQQSYETLGKMKLELPAVKIIGLSASNQPRIALRMLELGASGYLTKTSSLEEINQGIMEVHKGSVYVSEEMRKYISGNK